MKTIVAFILITSANAGDLLGVAEKCTSITDCQKDLICNKYETETIIFHNTTSRENRTCSVLSYSKEGCCTEPEYFDDKFKVFLRKYWQYIYGGAVIIFIFIGGRYWLKMKKEGDTNANCCSLCGIFIGALLFPLLLFCCIAITCYSNGAGDCSGICSSNGSSNEYSTDNQSPSKFCNCIWFTCCCFMCSCCDSKKGANSGTTDETNNETNNETDNGPISIEIVERKCIV